ncbi:MAG: lamin tail domain-containing protein [Chiayiivirga sp.]|jgi:hypothetical protein|uniref:lamin tail domain-containing protein n=1 Tax=Chiayiivirga sp. TaxID=2041042 RepID=UPI0025C2CD78|nr:lamin tail domain-containing protein [Chiayiivirga sp.]MCI1729325.1 lamin tail domain-containing protein [Chiayiivirga sp.]
MSFVRFLRPVAVLTLLACASSANAQVVISQIYPAGNNSGATFNQKYVEIFNRGASAVSLANKTLQYASPTGTGNFAVHATLSGSIGPGQYQLIVYDSPGAIGANLPVTGDFPDSTGSTPGGASGKFILADSAAALACNGGSTPCSPAQTALILDLVGYGTANYFEGAAAAPTLTATTAGFRASNGCTDANNNSADFATAGPNPRNSSTPVNSCSPAPSLSIAATSADKAEGDANTTPFTFTVTRSNSLTGTLSASYRHG